MDQLFSVPQWFFGIDLTLEIVFTIITLLVAFYAYKVYKLSGQPQAKLFSIAFLSIGLSYLSQVIYNLLLMFELNKNVCTIMKISNLHLLQLSSLYAESVFFIFGLLVLAYIALNVKSKRTFVLLFFVVYVAIFWSINKTFMLFVMASLLILCVFTHYVLNYLAQKKINALLMMLAMAFLFLSTIHFIFAVNRELFYVLGHIFQLLAYLLILTNIILVLKLGQKKEAVSKNGKKKK